MEDEAGVTYGILTVDTTIINTHLKKMFSDSKVSIIDFII